MSISEHMDTWNTNGSGDMATTTVSDVAVDPLKEGGSEMNQGKLDSDLASIVSSLSALSTPALQQQQQQQIGGFRRASFNSNAGSDVDSEIFFQSQNSPMIRRTTLSVSGVSLPGNSSHAQNRMNTMNHYSASIAGGLTSQFHTNASVNGYSSSMTSASAAGPINMTTPNGNVLVNPAENVGAGGQSGNVTSGFFERFGRALAEGTREVELTRGVAPQSSTTDATTGSSRRASATTSLEHLSRVGSGTTLQVNRRMSDTSEVLDSVSESLSMQHNEPNPTTIWNVASAPVFRPQNVQDMQQQHQFQLHHTQNQQKSFNGQTHSQMNARRGSQTEPELNVNTANPFGNQQVPFNYGYPGFNQMGMPMFLPPVMSPPPFGRMGGPNDQHPIHDGATAEREMQESNGVDSQRKKSNDSSEDSEESNPITTHPVPPYPFPTPFPFVYLPPNEEALDGNKDTNGINPPLSPSFMPPNPYAFMPPSLPLNATNMPEAKGHVYAGDNGSDKRKNDSKQQGRNKQNHYPQGSKMVYPPLYPPPTGRTNMANTLNQHHASHSPNEGKANRQGKNGRQNNKQPIIRSPLLEEFRNNPTNKVYKLSDIYGFTLEFCKDQHGSRFIQQELAHASDAEKEVVFNEIREECIPLSHDVFGNYVIQKFFENGTTTQKGVLVSQFKGKMEVLSLEMYACRVIQKALEFLDEDQKVELVSELSDCVLTMIKDQNGNHVIQKAIECIPIEKLPFILQSLRGQIYHLSTHSYGCRVVQRLLEFGTQKDQDDILGDLDEFIPFLIQDQYGNYVIQHILQHGTEDITNHIGKSKQAIIDAIAENVVEFSKHKFASNVVEKSVVYGSKNQIGQILKQILPKNEEHASELEDNAPLILMMRDQYANYVVQKLVGVSSGNDERLIVIAIRSYLEKSNKNNTLGNRHLASVEKLATLVERIQI